jgi:hypothetical protein
MNGIHAAFTGSIGKDADPKIDRKAPAMWCGWRCSAMPWAL